MASQGQAQEADARRRDRMPAGVRIAVFGAVGLVFVGSLFLIAVRGQALLVDLQALAGRIFCF